MNFDKSLFLITLKSVELIRSVILTGISDLGHCCKGRCDETRRKSNKCHFCRIEKKRDQVGIIIMQSIGKECTELKQKYDECFNSWFAEHYLKGNRRDVCQPLFRVYRDCIQKALHDNQIDFNELDKQVLKENESSGKFAEST
jgi:TRIAP1/MDM35 family protein